MAATVLNSSRAVEISVYIVRAFVKLRELLSSNKELARQFSQLEARPPWHRLHCRYRLEALKRRIVTSTGIGRDDDRSTYARGLREMLSPNRTRAACSDPRAIKAHQRPLWAQIIVKKSLDRRVGMSPVVLSYESVLRPGINHDIEGFAQILQLAK
jgi:hypothetical protein